jgi:ketosteroid isomerase-like protein
MLTADDRIAILELIARYNRALDRGDYGAVVSTFTSDGIFDNSLIGTLSGRAALLAGFKTMVTNPQYRAFRGGQHWVSNEVIIGDGETAHVDSDVLYVAVAPEPRIVTVGGYSDTVIKENGEWKFSRRCPVGPHD